MKLEYLFAGIILGLLLSLLWQAAQIQSVDNDFICVRCGQ